MHAKPASRRRHNAELKAKVLAACDEPGASVAAVAHAHDLNANLVHKWRRDRGTRRLSSSANVTASELIAMSVPAAPPAAAPGGPSATGMVELTVRPPGTKRAPTRSSPKFLPVQLEAPQTAPAGIRLELHRGAATLIVTWPAQEAAACGSWLREWLR
jgi:transposase